MKLSRREFLGGVAAGVLAAIAGKLPKTAELPEVEEVAQAEAAQIETGIGRGSPRIFDNFGLSLKPIEPSATRVVGMVRPMLKDEATYIRDDGALVRANDHDYVLGWASPVLDAERAF